MVHDMMGHAPLLGNADIADIYELFGKKSLKASDEVIEILGKLYFYCLEFGVLGNGKILGAGILGSSKETNHVGANDVKLKDFNFDDICNEEYVISDFQPYYYNIGSIKSLFKSLKVEFNKF